MNLDDQEISVVIDAMDTRII
jgi:cAMP-dependent protein kinase regulator